jgi:hypothetical protein
VSFPRGGNPGLFTTKGTKPTKKDEIKIRPDRTPMGVEGVATIINHQSSIIHNQCKGPSIGPTGLAASERRAGSRPDVSTPLDMTDMGLSNALDHFRLIRFLRTFSCLHGSHPRQVLEDVPVHPGGSAPKPPAFFALGQ